MNGILAAHNQGALIARGEGPVRGMAILQAKSRPLKRIESPVATDGALHFAFQLVGRDALRVDGKAATGGVRHHWQIDGVAGFIRNMQSQIVGEVGGKDDRSAIGGQQQRGFSRHST